MYHVKGNNQHRILCLTVLFFGNGFRFFLTCRNRRQSHLTGHPSGWISLFEWMKGDDNGACLLRHLSATVPRYTAVSPQTNPPVLVFKPHLRKICHYLFTIMLFQTGMTEFLLWNTQKKDYKQNEFFSHHPLFIASLFQIMTVNGDRWRALYCG